MSEDRKMGSSSADHGYDGPRAASEKPRLAGEMVQRVAEAIWLERNEGATEDHLLEALRIAKAGRRNTDFIEDLWAARAAIKALREPTPAMVEAMIEAAQRPGAEKGVVRGDIGLLAHAWYRMIDAALADAAP